MKTAKIEFEDANGKWAVSVTDAREKVDILCTPTPADARMTGEAFAEHIQPLIDRFKSSDRDVFFGVTGRGLALVEPAGGQVIVAKPCKIRLDPNGLN